MAIQHPSEYRLLRNWESELFGCCEDMSSCCYGCWCFPCFMCSTTAQFGDCRCLPLLDLLTPAAGALFGIPACVPPVTLALRVAIRHKYGIKGVLFDDICTSLCCMCCSWCQMAREMKKQDAIQNTQPRAVYTLNIQQPPHQLPQYEPPTEPQYPASATEVATGFVAQPQPPQLDPGYLVYGDRT